MCDPNYVSLFIAFDEEKLNLALLNLEKREILIKWELLLSNVVPELPKSVEDNLASKELSYKNLRSIYLAQKPSRWNSNRLVATFVRTVGFATSVSIYNLNLEKESKKDIESLNNQNAFWSFLEEFKRVDWRELKILYNSCSITNT